MNCDRFKQIEKVEKLEFRVYDSIEAINFAEWTNFNSTKNIYLSLPYLKALEQSLKNEIQFRYILFYDSQNELVAIAYLQLTNFRDSKTKFEDNICALPGTIKSKILKNLEVKVLVCGNIFSCGENGFMYSSKISPSAAYDNLSRALDQLRKSDNNKDFSVLLLKEFWSETTSISDQLLESSYYDFMIDVNMTLKIHSSWNNFDAYLQSMTTKFRTRAKGVFRKSKAVIKQSFEVEDILKYQNRIDELHAFVLEKADFNFGTIRAQAFIALKQNLKDQFNFIGYFLEDKLIGFSTSIIFQGIMDANFVGIDYQYNNQYALYQRMLYDFVALSINNKLTELRLGRTAEEIKSCIGAEPQNMKLYIKHKNSISNKIIKQTIKAIKPSEFELRKPFKAAFI